MDIVSLSWGGGGDVIRFYFFCDGKWVGWGSGVALVLTRQAEAARLGSGGARRSAR